MDLREKKTLKCLRCDYEWFHRVEKPKLCPQCKCRKYWEKKYAETKTE